MNKNYDSLGTRLKNYEFTETKRQFVEGLPIYARIDGRCFSKYTKGMTRPFDATFSLLMQETTKHLVEQTGALIGYTQSDEISLCWLREESRGQLFFEGKIQKMASVLASIATGRFVASALQMYPEKPIPTFDCRVFQLPSKEECANTFLWRELDATKNAVSMAAYHYYSSKQLFKKHTGEMLEMLKEKEVDFNEYPTAFRRGTFFKRIVEFRTLTEEERLKIPQKNRPESGQLFSRSKVILLEMPPFIKVQNRVEVIFSGAEPIQ